MHWIQPLVLTGARRCWPWQMVDSQTNVEMSISGSYRSRLSHGVIVKAPSLLPMLYKHSELELGVSVRMLQDWLAHDVPHHRDGHAHLRINSRDFAAWVRQKLSVKSMPELASGKAYFARCRKPVALVY